jgi:diaminopimelate epimerase
VSSRVDPAKLAAAVCDRNFGIGADGLLLVRTSAAADLAMAIFNEDGTEAEMCGNGVRCFARYVLDERITDRTALEIETGAGTIRTWVLDDGRVRVDMGSPALAGEDVAAVPEGGRVTVVEEGRRFIFVSMGNPHAVAFVDDHGFDWRAEGARVERSPSFPRRTNVEYVKVIGPTEAVMKVWERGCGETLACGTGACAVAVAGALEGTLGREPVLVHLPGGDLTIHWNEEGRVMMTGPAVTVCSGTYHHVP